MPTPLAPDSQKFKFLVGQSRISGDHYKGYVEHKTTVFKTFCNKCECQNERNKALTENT